jgi:hypothetical protein
MKQKTYIIILLWCVFLKAAQLHVIHKIGPVLKYFHGKNLLVRDKCSFFLRGSDYRDRVLALSRFEQRTYIESGSCLKNYHILHQLAHYIDCFTSPRIRVWRDENASETRVAPRKDACKTQMRGPPHISVHGSW